MQNNEFTLAYNVTEKHLRVNYMDHNGVPRYAIFTPTTDSAMS